MTGKLHGYTNRLLTWLSMNTGWNLNKPTYICAQMTMRCNSRCAHCNIWKMTFDQRELSTAEWLDVLDRLRRWLGPFRMVMTGGEALLRGDMPEILCHATSLGIDVELLTNGIDVDEALAAQLVATGIGQVTLSYDGVTAEIHDRFRGGEGFHRDTRATILALNRHRRERNTPLKILLKTVISAQNVTELSAIARWAAGEGLEVRFQPIEQNYGEEPAGDWYLRSALWVRDIPALRSELATLRQLKEQGLPIANQATDFDLFLNYFEKPEELMTFIQGHDTKRRRNQCAHAVGNFVISSNGDVRMCFRMSPIGNVAQQRPEEIWNKRPRCWAGPCDFR